LERDFELKDGDELVATLCFRSLFGSYATADTADGSWTFKRVGFWKTHVTIHSRANDAEVGAFRNNTWTSGGTLELPDGRRFPANTNFWRSTFEFKTERGETLVRYHRIGGLVHASARVEIEPTAAAMEELPWLVALGWYLAVKMRDDDAGTGAAAAAAG
jgi:hypothetical protein